MPALGMAQDTGLIVAWHKAPGDPVKADDVLMEVETDKATMEIEAGRDGTLAEIRAEAGVPVPVGQTVAVIAFDGESVAPADSGPAPARPAAPPQPAEKAKAPAAAQPREPMPAAAAAAPADGGRILASPKARMEAHRRGLDLAALVRTGLQQPIHVADLDRVPAPAIAPAAGAAPSTMRMEVARAAFDDFAGWAQRETGGAAGSPAVWAAFAAGTLREVLEPAPEAVVVEAAAMTGEPMRALDPDRKGLSEPHEATDAAPHLRVQEMSGIDYRPSRIGAAPMLVVSGDGDILSLTVHFDEGSMPPRRAALILDRLAARVADPLRQLL